ncbi:hypothetical protein JND74_003761 [Salmonella enterica]|nr:hypothetical protein [Salmonella enterica]EKA1639281.1 hypothetical protein [Salmonella enterica]ELS1746370.1 hypothetical protein [Salmonella enterica]ELW3720532.1 hypothetical protein [Salmonella enterica]EMB7326560.1 hypothetical protein [Salmonella enterica]
MSDVIAIFDGSSVIGKAKLQDDLIHRVEMMRQIDEESGEPDFFIHYLNKEHVFNHQFGEMRCTDDQTLAFTAYSQVVATIKANMEFAETIMKQRQERGDC